MAADANNAGDIFVHDRQTGQTTRVSVSSSGAEAQGASNDPAISADGRFVAFVSDAANLVAGDTGGYRNVFLHDRQTGQTTRISAGFGGITVDGDSDSPAISGDGGTIVFRSDATNLLAAGSDTNVAGDIFAYDRLNWEYQSRLGDIGRRAGAGRIDFAGDLGRWPRDCVRLECRQPHRYQHRRI